MTEPHDIEFNFVGKTDVYVIVTFGFVARDGKDRISFKEIEEFREKLKEDVRDNSFNICDNKYDDRETEISFSKRFCENSEYETKQNLPLIFSVESNILNKSTDEAEFGSKNNTDTLPEEAKVKITNYGVASIKFHYKILKDEKCLRNYIDQHENRRDKSRLYHAENIWKEFIEVWNRLGAREIKEKPNKIDYYSVGVSQGIDVKKGEETIPIVRLNEKNITWEDGAEVDEDVLQSIRRRLVGINRLSPERWSE